MKADKLCNNIISVAYENTIITKVIAVYYLLSQNLWSSWKVFDSIKSILVSRFVLRVQRSLNQLNMSEQVLHAISYVNERQLSP